MTETAATLARTAPSPPLSPYKGLTPFTEKDAAFFFGRESEREIIAANLLAARLTILYGPSGVGKSSVLFAGVVGDLHRRARENSEDDGSPGFAVVVVRSWRDHPLETVRAAARASVVEVLGRDDLPDPPAGATLADLLDHWAAQVEGKLLVVFDQFEEYFLYHEHERGPGSLDEELPRAVNRPDVRANVLISIREDALAKLDAFKGRIPNLFANFLRLDRLDRRAARSAILGPIEELNRRSGDVSYEVEPALVDAVLAEVAVGRIDPGLSGRGVVDGAEESGRVEVAYLQLVLQRVWEVETEAGSRTLRLETLRRLGGAERIVEDHLERALGRLTPSQKDIAARIFGYLVTPSGTKIAHDVRDLARYASVDEAELEGVVIVLAGERILRSLTGEGEDGRRYEIFHDVLAAAVLAWTTRYEAARALEQQRLEAEHRHRRLVAVAGISLVALAAMLAVTVFALVQRSNASARARQAHARELDATALAGLGTDPQHSLREALTAAQLSPSAQAEDVLRTTLLASRLRAVLPAGGPVTSALYSRDGRLILTASTDGKARIYDAGSHRLLRTLDARSPLTGAVFDPSGRLVVTDGRDGAARLWLAATGRQLHVFRHRGAVLSAGFSQGGQLLVTTGADRTARIWRLPSGTSVRVIREPGPVLGAAFDHDGSEVVTRNTDSVARLYATNDGRLLRTFDQGGTVAVAMFSPRRNLLLTAGANETARIWNPKTGRLLTELKGHTGRVLGAAFPPNGRLVATVSSDASGRVWAFPSGQLITVLLGHANYATSAAFSPDGYSLVTTSDDRTARVWKPDTGGLRAVLAGHTESVSGASFRPDGAEVITASDDGTARIWDPRLEPELVPIVQGAAPLHAARFSPDGSRIVVAGPGAAATIRDATTGRVLRSFALPGRAADATFGLDGRLVAIAAGSKVVLGDGRVLRAPASVDSVSIAPDGRIAAGLEGGTVQIWDAKGGPQRVIRVRPSGPVGVAFSPDSERIATGTRDDVARVWDVDSGKLELRLRGHRDQVTSARFSPDGSQLVTASLDHDARIWDATTGRLLHVLRGHFAVVSDAEFSPDGRWVVTAGPTTAGLWDVRTGQLVFFLRGHRGRLTSATFDPSGRRILTASVDGTARTSLCDVCGGLDSLVALAKSRLAHSASLR